MNKESLYEYITLSVSIIFTLKRITEKLSIESDIMKTNESLIVLSLRIMLQYMESG